MTFPGSPPEPVDILLHPAERGDEVEHSGIPRMLPGRAADIAEIEEPEDVEAVVDADHDDIAAPRQIGSIIDPPVGGMEGEPAAMKPDHHRPLRPITEAGGPQIECQAVLGFGGIVSRAQKSIEWDSVPSD